ncbi:MAG TPA: tRNA adenosine(34) deaminase TadA [Dissulfurispiraceae bacterium]|nr:tRNA adenosine(34) deaminase TadA [Dissulfurispiraceae bacterium]
MGDVDQDAAFMRLALAEAQAAFDEEEVPVGAILVVDGQVIVSTHNNREASFDPTGHAEIMAVREGAGKLGRWRLSDATLFVTKEPCPMCAGAMVNARLGRLVYGCGDPKGGAVANLYHLLSDSRLNHQVEVVSGVLEDECAQLLKKFFTERRNANKE